MGAYDRSIGLDVDINRDLCMGSGNCVYAAPGVFGLDDDSVAFVVYHAGSSEISPVAWRAAT
jgi:ferredoxin